MEQINKYEWLKYQQIKTNHWLVLRLFRDEYVIHLYNYQDGGYYYGIYCGDDLEKAELVYRNKLAYYQGENILSKPHHLIPVLNHVRLTGLCNMLDIAVVIEILEDYGENAIAQYIRENRDRYGQILGELGEYVREHQSKSLAQQLAVEMGWQVIVD